MTAANGLNQNPPVPRSALHRCIGGVIAAMTVLMRPVRFHVHSPWSEPQRLAVATGAAVAMIILVMFLFDAPAINGVARLPNSIVWCFDQITDFGKSGWFLAPLVILFLALAALPSLPPLQQRICAALMVRVGFLAAAIAAPSLFSTIVKRVIGRARPLVGGTLDPFLFSPFKWIADYASLPSGHATTAFAVLVAFGTQWPRVRTILWVYALLIATSRVVVTAHYPSDVLAGAFLGVAGVLVVRRYFALRGLGFSVAADGATRPFPGPSLKRIKAVARRAAEAIRNRANENLSHER